MIFFLNYKGKSGIIKIQFMVGSMIQLLNIMNIGNANACITYSHFVVLGKMNKIVHFRRSSRGDFLGG